jgi:hypothetical protein
MQAFDLDKVKKWSLFKSFGGTDGSNFTKAFSVVVQNNRGRFSLPYWRLARTNTASFVVGLYTTRFEPGKANPMLCGTWDPASSSSACLVFIPRAARHLTTAFVLASMDVRL